MLAKWNIEVDVKLPEENSPELEKLFNEFLEKVEKISEHISGVIYIPLEEKEEVEEEKPEISVPFE